MYQNCYIISYQLSSNTDTSALQRAIQTYKGWAKITSNTWAVITADSATSVRDHLKKFIGTNDRLIVIKSGTEAAWSNVICSHTWLKKNL